MKKVVLIVLVVLFLLVGGVLVWAFDGGVTGNVVFVDLPHYTRAICDGDNFCQDYKVYCEDGELMGMVAIEGAVIQHFDDWVDPRVDGELC
ncbi:hypothetical protein HNV12_03270 [Methanococcoides sp. SA1]|nr:hypothetical protein [Methanococcoides sp. SA1]